jgi:predicted TPR repeat methyltransferase
MKTPDDYSISTAYSYTDSKELSTYYDDSADGYDEYASSVGYILPRLVAEKALQFIDGNEKIIDIGCGTGILGVELNALKDGLSIHGVDISPEMIIHAYRKKRVDGERHYGVLYRLDLTTKDTIPENQYNFMVSSGTFTTGHLEPRHLTNIIKLLANNSYAVFSVKSDHFEESGFMSELSKLSDQNLIEILEISEVDSYDNDGYTALSRIISLKIN